MSFVAVVGGQLRAQFLFRSRLRRLGWPSRDNVFQRGEMRRCIEAARALLSRAWPAGRLSSWSGAVEATRALSGRARTARGPQRKYERWPPNQIGGAPGTRKGVTRAARACRAEFAPAGWAPERPQTRAETKLQRAVKVVSAAESECKLFEQRPAGQTARGYLARSSRPACRAYGCWRARARGRRRRRRDSREQTRSDVANSRAEKQSDEEANLPARTIENGPTELFAYAAGGWPRTRPQRALPPPPPRREGGPRAGAGTSRLIYGWRPDAQQTPAQRPVS